MNECHIPTITGTNVITFNPNSASGSNAPLVYAVVLSQVSTNAPTVDVEVVNSLNVNPTYVRNFQGQYQLIDTNNNFTEDDTIVVNGGNKSNGFVTNAYRITDNSIEIQTFDHSNHTVDFQDDVMDKLNLSIYKYNQGGGGGGGGTPEEQFDLIILDLDTTQLSIWEKIIIRDSGIVIEVDGNIYRRTSNYADSSKVINS